MTRTHFNIELLCLHYPFPETIQYEYSGGLMDNQYVELVRVTRDNGAYGLGEVTHGQFCHPIAGLVQHFKELLVGKSVFETNSAWKTMFGSSVFWNRQGPGIGVMGGIIAAMYDLVGKLRRLPVYEWLGGLVRSRTQTYSSNGLFRDPGLLIADARHTQSSSFDAYKMRVVNPGSLIPMVAAFMAGIPDLDLIVDGVQGSRSVPWSIALSKQLSKELARYNVPWFEKPCRVENIKGYVEVRRSTSMTLVRNESLPTAAAFKPNLDREEFGIETFDCSTSGFTDEMRITTLADVHHRPAAIHSWGSVVSALTGLQLALVMPSCAITEYGFMDHPLNDLPSVEPLRPKDGYFEAPTRSVLGLQLDDGRLQKHPYVATQNTMVSGDEADIRLTGIGGRRSVPEGNYSDMVFGNHYLTPAGPHEPATAHS